MISIVDGELRLFRGNLASRDSQRQQLELQIGQVTEEVAGLVKQKDAKRKARSAHHPHERARQAEGPGRQATLRGVEVPAHQP